MVSHEALQELLQSAEALVQTAKMMRAVGTGGMAGTHPKMLALTQAVKVVKEELTPPPAPTPYTGRGESEEPESLHPADGDVSQGEIKINLTIGPNATAEDVKALKRALKKANS